MPPVFFTDPGLLVPAGIQPAIDTLRSGGLIAGPTQTFYGLMAAADQPRALERLAALKGREGSKPLLLLLDGPERVPVYARETSASAARLIQAFWPGPLTLLFQAVEGLHPALAGPDGRVGLRVEGLPLVRTLVRALGRAVTGTSANPAGRPPAETADEVLAYFGEGVDAILDGGPRPGPLPSTLIDVALDPPRLLRPGAVFTSRIQAVLPELKT